MYTIFQRNHSLARNSKLLIAGHKYRLKIYPLKTCSLCHVSNVRVVSRELDQPRGFHTGAVVFDAEPLKPSSKVEETVTALKEKARSKAQECESEDFIPEKEPSAIVAPVKKSLKKKIVDELVHYYHGFRLLFIDINVSRKLVWRILQGKQLSRREHKLLIRTVGDVFRLVPFSVFIIVPFLELTLPLFIKFFPNMLPSTFQTTSDKEDKMKKSLKVKLEMAKFLQKTLDEMAVSGKGHSSQAAKDFAAFFEKVRTSGEMTRSEDIMKFSKLFEDEITLDSLPRPQLMALCRVLDMNPIGTTNFLRFQLRLKLRSLAADDMMIQKEGINSLTQSELQAACRARGMRALGVSEARLKAQLSQWLDLSLNKKVPPSLLLLSQAFMLPETTPTEEKLAATIQALPDVVGTATKAVIGEREGKVDFKTKIDIIREECAMISEERKEELEEDIKLKAKEERQKEEIMVDTAPTLVDSATQVDPVLQSVIDDIKRCTIPEKLATDEVTSKDMEALESALETLGKDRKKLLIEKEELQELREEMAEYQEDIADLQRFTSVANKEDDVKETVAAKLLFRKVNKMISKMETVLNQLEKDSESMDKDAQIAEAEAVAAATAAPHKKPKQAEESLRIDDLINTIRKIQGVQNSSLEKLYEVLSKMDADKDGAVRVDLLVKMLELVGSEKVTLNNKQIDELIALIDKEEAIEMDESIFRALKKDEEAANEKSGNGKPPPPSPLAPAPPPVLPQSKKAESSDCSKPTKPLLVVPPPLPPSPSKSADTTSPNNLP